MRSEDSLHDGVADPVVDALPVRTADKELVLGDHRDEDGVSNSLRDPRQKEGKKTENEYILILIILSIWTSSIM